MDGQGRTKAAGVVGLFLCGVVGVASGKPPAAPPTLPSSVAPGYIDDRACASCHAEIAGASPQLGMARSFYRPSAARVIENFGPVPGIARFDHPASHQSFSMERRGDRLFFKRWQTAADGRPVNVFEHEVDWILGSGNHARIYLYRTPEGELYQLPLAWYTQEGRWGMAPGYDRPDHDGVLRRVRRECLFCHDGYPEVASGSVGSDAYGAPQVYPERLPEGLGCQRCHGPGGEHVRRASGGAEPREAIRAAIVNPARLGGPLAEDVCNQCHLQPEVTLPMVRRFGRGDYSFRPGEPLSDYLVQTDFADEGAGKAGEERFEINHHSYRLRQSRCFLASPENPAKLRCWTCHDPHRRLPQEELATRVRTACLACHGGAGSTGAGTTCKRPGAPPAPVTAVSDPVDCASCHLPKRRPRDVVHVVMTDHKIQRFPGEQGVAELTAPRAEADPILTAVRLYDPERAPAGELGKLYLTLSQVRTGAYPGAVERLEGLLATLAMMPSADPTPYLELAAAEIKEQRFAAAERTLGIVLARSPENPQALARQGVALAALGRPREAEERWRQALALAKSGELDRTEVRFNLALLLAGQGRTAEAVPLFEQVLAARPTLVAGWVQLGNVAARLGRFDRATEVYRRALEVDPTQTDAYLGLATALLRQGQRAEALRVLTHGAGVARRPAAVAAALAALQASPPG